MPEDDVAEETTGEATAVQAEGQAEPASEENEWPTLPPRVVGLCFRKGGKVYYFHPGDFPVRLGDFVVVETDRGVDIGEVVSLKSALEPGEEEPTKRLVRLATPGDVRKKKTLTEKEQRAFRTCEQKIREHGLEMKLIDASYTLDGRRLTFSFVSEGRVDFRELVKDLAHTFRCRIELRQVGVRDQAKLIGGLGPCGRPLCCATFLRDFSSVGIRLAKDQGLSLNPAKISGACDRLMCCLRFEHAQYVEMGKRLPKVGATVEAQGLKGEVVERNLLVGAVKIRTEEGREVVLTCEQLLPESVAGPEAAAPAQGKEERRRRRRERRRPASAAPVAAGQNAPSAASAAPTAEAQPAAPAAVPAEHPTTTAQAPHGQSHKGQRKRRPRHRRKKHVHGHGAGGHAQGEAKPAAGGPEQKSPTQAAAAEPRFGRVEASP